MKIEYDLRSRRVTLSEHEGVVSDEAIPADDLLWMQHQMWLLANTTVNERLSAIASRFECIVAALINDTDAIILRRVCE